MRMNGCVLGGVEAVWYQSVIRHTRMIWFPTILWSARRYTSVTSAILTLSTQLRYHLFSQSPMCGFITFTHTKNKITKPSELRAAVSRVKKTAVLYKFVMNVASQGEIFAVKKCHRLYTRNWEQLAGAELESL